MRHPQGAPPAGTMSHTLCFVLNVSAYLNCASKGGIVPLQKAISYLSLSLSLYWQQSSKRWKTQHIPLVITHKSTRDPSLRSVGQPLACHPERSEGSQPFACPPEHSEG